MLSPVTMRTKMPAFWQVATAPGTSARTGSCAGAGGATQRAGSREAQRARDRSLPPLAVSFTARFHLSPGHTLHSQAPQAPPSHRRNCTLARYTPPPPGPARPLTDLDAHDAEPCEVLLVRLGEEILVAVGVLQGEVCRGEGARKNRFLVSLSPHTSLVFPGEGPAGRAGRWVARLGT